VSAIVIAPYDPAWPEAAAAEAAAILRACEGRVRRVEHVGSTAVPGLGAKPTLDLLGGVRDLADVIACLPALAALGYAYVPEYEAEIPERRYFRKGPVGARTHHLHVVVEDGAFWVDHVLFRDRLRADRSTADAYERLKRDLAARHGADRDAYTRAKTTFIAVVLARPR
jgi:GrpB-like predicted nucleotidyltransferase (UPF0157 family)